MTQTAKQPVIDRAAEAAPDQRLVMRLMAYWEQLSADGACPSLEDFEFDAVGDLRQHCFLLYFGEDVMNPHFGYVGQTLADDCGIDLTHKTLADIPRRSLLTRVADNYLQILANRCPIGFEGEFTNASGRDVKYRGIIAPFSENGEEIDFVLGAISCKAVGDAAA